MSGILLCESYSRVMVEEHLRRGAFGITSVGWLDEIHVFDDGERKLRREIWHECWACTAEGNRLARKLWGSS